MRKLLLPGLLLLLLESTALFSQALPPKREFRGAWIATVINLDWPSSPFLTPEAQRAELIRLLDEMRSHNLNAVMFQVRSECDAMYPSTIEPWSYWLTGQQGKAPAPFYDPLAFAVEAAHERGIELHAWFNPYRASRQVGNYANDPNHVTVKHPEWDIQIGTIKFLDPGLPQVRDYVTSVVLDVVRRYDVDGVHFDDYFYPYPPNQISTQDNATFTSYSRGFTDRGNWRRDNVNLLIQMIHDSIQVAKPHVKFGMSPFGIWQNGVPAGISGLDAYSTIYCDAVAWLNRQIVDYITPQLYWPFGGAQDYGKLMPWWGTQRNSRHFYPGQAPYRVNASDGNWAANEIPRQVRANRGNANVSGSVFFRAETFRENYKGFADSLKNDLFRAAALPPIMAWKDGVAPNAPQNLRYERIAGTGTAGLRWEVPLQASDGDSATRYAIYRFSNSNIQPSDLVDPSRIINITSARRNRPQTPSTPGPFYFVATALDHNANESLPSNVLQVSAPAMPLLALPANGAVDQLASVTLRWYYPTNAASYRVQIAADSNFGTLLVNVANLEDTSYVVSSLAGQRTYYWRVSASNVAGTSAFSPAFVFTTGFPATPALAFPANNTPNIPLQLNLQWRKTPGAEKYRLQFAKSANFDAASLVLEAQDLADTAYAVSQLELNRFYFWRVSAANALGTSLWSETWRFKTTTSTTVAEAHEVPQTFTLYQNYPNPFNPVTTIAFDLPTPGFVRLKVFDVLGREIVTIIEHDMPAGRHQAPFDGRLVGSGVYYYRLEFEREVQTRRMLLTK
ncbi:MAG: family 10 glycosylhydrolase [candidate division KSB1 bacterium]